MGAPRAPYMARIDKERLITGSWNRIESNQVTDYNTPLDIRNISLLVFPLILDLNHLSASESSLIVLRIYISPLYLDRNTLSSN